VSRSSYLIKDFEHRVNGRVLCIEYGLLRCSECAYVDGLEKQNKRYREAMQKGINATRYTKPEVAYILNEALEGEE